MSIKTFSKPYFIEVAMDIIKHDEFICARNTDKLTVDTSFRNVLDITSLDIAELVISIEQKFNVDMAETPTEKIDCINDLYIEFLKSVLRRRRAFIQKQTMQNNALIK